LKWPLNSHLFSHSNCCYTLIYSDMLKAIATNSTIDDIKYVYEKRTREQTIKNKIVHVLHEITLKGITLYHSLHYSWSLVAHCSGICVVDYTVPYRVTYRFTNQLLFNVDEFIYSIRWGWKQWFGTTLMFNICTAHLMWQMSHQIASHLPQPIRWVRPSVFL